MVCVVENVVWAWFIYASLGHDICVTMFEPSHTCLFKGCHLATNVTNSLSLSHPKNLSDAPHHHLHSL